MTTQRFESFEQFWPYYLGEHRSPVSRSLHYAGTIVSSVVVLFGVIKGIFWLVPLAIAAGYGLAWVGHFMVEGNKPATFSHPLWSLAADYKMLWLAFQGKMDAEMVRYYGSANPPPDAPLRPQ